MVLKRYVICVACVFIALVFLSSGFAEKNMPGTREQESLGPYFELRRLYWRWDHGLFGGRKFHEQILKKYCYSLIGKYFRTDYDYYLVTPEGIDGMKVECRFDQCRWLKIRGDIDGESIKDVLHKRPSLLKSWWRSTILVAVSGTVKKYRLSRDPLGNVVELYFENVILIPHMR